MYLSQIEIIQLVTFVIVSGIILGILIGSFVAFFSRVR